jgi:mono/diheme cytochrome c family protein/glucose/arabinose dehydrogenase
MNKYWKLFFIFIALILIGAKFPFEDSPVLTPADEQKTFVLEKGLKIKLVAAEPLVQDPVVIQFDEDGRLWVVEMRGYMPDVEGNNENEKIGRISVLEDINGDGLMDKSTVYLDSLVLPRAIALIKGGILVAENQALWECLDTNNDLKADTKTLIDKDYAGGAAPEHSGNGLLRNIDNWYYNAKSRFRYKKIDGKWTRDSTEFRGQWGMSQDDKGRLVYNYNWSQLHGDLVPPNYLSRNKNHSPSSGIDFGYTTDRRVYPIRETPAVNRGYIPGTLDEKNRLLEFTAACSPFVYRENTLPKAYFGNIFVCEPTGNLIKRNKIVEKGLEIMATDPHPGVEFLASTDERFRPVNLATGPSGALYVVDMYKGIMQHKLYETPYLKDQYLKRGLDKFLHKGRIWRIVPESWQPPKAEKLSQLNSEQLVAKLSSSDGWQRDMAQKLLVEKADKSVGKALENVTKTGNDLAKLHAIYTLEGLGFFSALPFGEGWGEVKKANRNHNRGTLLLQLASDKFIPVSNASLKIFENLIRNDISQKSKYQSLLQKLSINAPIERALQIALSSEPLDSQVKFTLLANILNKYGSSPIIKDAAMSSLGKSEFEFLKFLNKSLTWQKQNTDKEIFLEMLTTAIIKNGNAEELSSVLSLINQKPNNWQEKAYMMGLTIQSNNISVPFKLEKEPAILSKNNTKIADYNKDKLLKMFEYPGHIPTKEIDKDKIVLKPDEQKMFAKGRIQFLNTCAGCHGADGKGIPRFAPKLAGSEWVIGNEIRLALIVLHGIEGAIEVGGKKYDTPEILPVMPAHSTVDDASITNILTYIRNEWGNNAGPISKNLVGKIRHTTQGRVQPWKVADLNKHVEGLNSDK